MNYSFVVLMALAILASGCATFSGPNEEASGPENPGNQEEVPDSGPEESPDETSSESNEEKQNNTIVFSDQGFKPSDLTIEKGETVTWISNTSISMWVASDRHPDHTNYAGSSRGEHCQAGDQTEPAFDQCSTGKKFSFTFEKTGEWGYHNHKPYLPGGTITVVE